MTNEINPVTDIETITEIAVGYEFWPAFAEIMKAMDAVAEAYVYAQQLLERLLEDGVIELITWKQVEHTAQRILTIAADEARKVNR